MENPRAAKRSVRSSVSGTRSLRFFCREGGVRPLSLAALDSSPKGGAKSGDFREGFGIIGTPSGAAAPPPSRGRQGASVFSCGRWKAGCRSLQILCRGSGCALSVSLRSTASGPGRNRRLLPALATNSPPDCLLNASRPQRGSQEWRSQEEVWDDRHSLRRCGATLSVFSWQSSTRRFAA